jgi:SAM-dependent MidA family methyltransferase
MAYEARCTFSRWHFVLLSGSLETPFFFNHEYRKMINDARSSTNMPSAQLTVLLRERIARSGAIPFADFMELALYHPDYGYYMTGREKVGWEGDYFTSVDLHFLFGACIARQLVQMWTLLGRPQDFSVREYGAGRGLLARDIWCYACDRAPDFARALHYTLVDVVPASSELQARRRAALAASLENLPMSKADEREHLTPGVALSQRETEIGKGRAAPITWAHYEDVVAQEPIIGCIIANELIDAFPVHIVEVRGGRFYEVYVTERQGHLVETLGEVSTPDILSYLAAYKVDAACFDDGWRAEVNLHAPQWLASTAGQLRRGFLLTIDYGDRARSLYTRARRRGTLAAYYRHTLSDRPLARPGEQDLTAHVNFSALIDAGRRVGLRLAGLTTQRNFLLALGIRDELETLCATLYGDALRDRASDSGQIALLRTYSLRNAVNALIDPAGLGRFRVLIQHRGAPGASKKLLGLRRVKA